MTSPTPDGVIPLQGVVPSAGVDQDPVEASSDAQHQERMEYIRQLVKERDTLASNSPSCDVARRLIEQELEKAQNGKRGEDKRTVEVTKEKSIKVTVKVLVPVREHPKFNFVGKLLGPKGNSLKRLQEETMTKMAILGRGSFRDKAKEEELRKNPDPKYNHLHEDLHVEVTAHAPPAEAYARIAYALTEIRRYLVPDHNDEIRQEQMREMQLLSGRPPTLDGVMETAESPGSLSPPNSISPPPTGTLKVAGQFAATPAAVSQAALAPALFTHPALRGLTRAQMGLLTTVPGISPAATAPTTALAGGLFATRFPTLFPFGTVAPQPLPAQARSLPMYEDYAEISSFPEYEASLTNGIDVSTDKSEAALKAVSNGRGTYRHSPYKRIIVTQPS